MKKRLLFVSLFLISILFISSCAQESPLRVEDSFGSDVDCDTDCVEYG